MVLSKKKPVLKPMTFTVHIMLVRVCVCVCVCVWAAAVKRL